MKATQAARSSGLPVATRRRIVRGTMVSVMSGLPAALSFSQSSSGFVAEVSFCS